MKRELQESGDRLTVLKPSSAVLLAVILAVVEAVVEAALAAPLKELARA